MISRQALKHLRLDEIWWMVSPQNPLKAAEGMASLEERMASAKKVARHPRIRVTDIETTLNTRFTADTLAQLSDAFSTTRFVWMMGADNLLQVPEWQNWLTIFRLMPVAVFGRPSYSLRAMASKAAKRFAQYRVMPDQAHVLADLEPPAWSFIHYRHDPISATAIRESRS